MRPQDAESKIKELARALDVTAFLAKMREYERGDHRTASMSDGRGSAESACPVAVTPETEDWRPHQKMPKGRVLGVADPTDRQIRTDRIAVEQDLQHAALALVHASQIITAWTVPRTDDTEKAEKLAETAGVPCGNVYCHDSETGTQRRITGLQNNRGRKVEGVGPVLCERCYRYEVRTGKRWTPALEAAEAS